eukprot:4160042-Prymnesium_polylepis.1
MYHILPVSPHVSGPRSPSVCFICCLFISSLELHMHMSRDAGAHSANTLNPGRGPHPNLPGRTPPDLAAARM